MCYALCVVRCVLWVVVCCVLCVVGRARCVVGKKGCRLHGLPLMSPPPANIVPRLPRKRGGDRRDARAYIRPLGSAHCPRPATQTRRRLKGRQGVVRPLGSADCATPAMQKRRRPKGRQGVHPTPWQCTLCQTCHAKEAETQGTPGRTSDLLAVHIVPRLPRKSGGDPRDARAYIRPLGSAHCATPATQTRRRPKGRQGAHPTPWQCRLCHTCYAKEAETQGTPGRTVEVPFWPPCFYWFFGSCFGSHDEAGLLAFEALQGLPRPARGTHGRSYCGRNRL